MQLHGGLWRLRDSSWMVELYSDGQVTILIGIIMSGHTSFTSDMSFMPRVSHNSTEQGMTMSLNMPSFVEVELGQEAVLECRVENLTSHHLVSI